MFDIDRKSNMTHSSELFAITTKLNENLASESSMEIGAKIRHPNGSMVIVLSGYFLDPVYNRVSNFWTWQYINDDGVLGLIESGYGW